MTARPKAIARLVMLLPAMLAWTAAARAAVTDEQIEAAVQRATAWLWQRQQPDGLWPYKNPNRPEEHLLATWALVCAGTPVDDPRLTKAMGHLARMDTNETYVRSARLMALGHYYRRLPREKQTTVLKAIAADAEWLIQAQGAGGGWRYGPKPGNPRNLDISVTGFAVTALGEAVRCGVRVPKQTFALSQQLLVKYQRSDGGWNYGDQGQLETQLSYGSMTASAMASLLLVTDLLCADAGGCPCKGSRSQRSAAVPHKAIDGGLQWLAARFAGHENPGKGDNWLFYWLYQAQRVGLDTGLRTFGARDWYQDGAAELLKRQEPSGKIGSIQDTSFALLFLAMGRRPLAFNKLWVAERPNPFRADLDRLTDYISRFGDRSATWQAIGLDAPLDLWHEAPIAYLAAESTMEIDDAGKKMLRAFTDTGGTVLMEAGCGSPAGKTFLEQLAKDVWPEYPLKVVDKDHPVWSAGETIRLRRPGLQHADDGIRSFLFYSPRDLSCAWHGQPVTRSRDLFDLGGNLVVYATDGSRLRARLSARPAVPGPKYASQKLSPGPKRQFTVARVKHAGNWNVGANYCPWQRLADGAKKACGLTIKLGEPAEVGRPLPAGVDVLYLTGREKCDLGDGGPAWLRQTLAGGAFLLAEAALGDERFDGSLKAALDAAGLAIAPFAADAPPLTGKLFEATGYDLRQATRTPALQKQGVGAAPPELYGIYADKRLVGVYSPHDVLFSQTGLRAFGNRGYTADDARAIAANLLLLVSVRK